MNVAVLGASGSVGSQALEVIRALPGRFALAAVSVGRNGEALAKICDQYEPKYAAIADESGLTASVRAALRNVELFAGPTANEDLCCLPEVDAVVLAIPGMQAIHPLLAAAREKKRIAVANKECLVCGGDFVRHQLETWGAELYPVDSEQSAIFQCLQGLNGDGEIERLILTASGGPFRTRSRSSLASVSVKEALVHPNWEMGKKITIDSATMVNKGLEVIEAHYLFNVPPDRIEVLIHPQSIVHSMVETVDGAVLAQLGAPDMRLPIQYALSFPDRVSGPSRKMTLSDWGQLDFMAADFERFPGLALAYRALIEGGTATAIYNAADEVAVDAFLRGEIGFLQIEDCIAEVLEQLPAQAFCELETMLEADARARDCAKAYCQSR